MKPGFLLVQWAGCGSRDCAGNLGALGNEDSLAPTFPAVVPNVQKAALSSQPAEGNLENAGLAEICRLPSAELNDVAFAVFSKALHKELRNVQNPQGLGCWSFLQKWFYSW